MYQLKENLKRNDILVEQFGYSMTLYNFYKVLSVKGNQVQLYPLKKNSGEWCGFMECEVKPVDTKCYLTKNILNKRFNKYNGITVDKNSLYKYNGNTQYIENHAD